MATETTPKTVLLTLGRLPKSLELARALKGAGCRVLVADPFAWHLSRPSNAVDKCYQTPPPAKQQSEYLDALLTIIKAENVDLVVPVSEEALHVSLLAPRLPERTQIFTNPHGVLWDLNDKYLFNRLAQSAGLPAPETHLANDPEAARLVQTTPCVFKPRIGCSGQKMQMLTPDAVPEGLLSDADAIVQKRVFGRELSTLTLCQDGKILAHVTYEGLVFSGTVAVCFQRVEDAPQVAQWVADFVAANRYSYFLAFDFIVDQDGTPWPLECNPRLTSGIHFMEHGDLAAAVCDPDNAPPVRLKAKKRFQEGHTTLLQVYGSVLKPKQMARRAGAMVTSRDVLWSGSDPLPFPVMTFSSWPVLKQVLFGGKTFGEAATLDIAWPAGFPEANATRQARAPQPVRTEQAVSAADPVNAHET
ncbi:ATP-grasp domain-containing protein [Roseibium alexandrii]|uniref:Carbamoyl phosphate synthase-like protein n=1 Tax=Roseibium alexandrii TaxID=388408 RepID=A0A0M7ADW6_9HYPH|nr:ATP-grasp domain-containing protein [Roseibium alexandrii]CTQ71933.1 carbamoyl phosphate synthase-like protein [Roseibium alexandrii]